MTRSGPAENRREWDTNARFPERRARIGGPRDPRDGDEFGDEPRAVLGRRNRRRRDRASRRSRGVRLCRPGGSHERDACASDRSDLKRRGRRPVTIARKLAAIAVYHRSMDHPTPTTAIPDDLRGRRDRALLLVGWAAAVRRSEPEGVVLTLRPLQDRSRGRRHERRGSAGRRRGDVSGRGPAPLARGWGNRRGAHLSPESIATVISGRRYRIGR
jgi:hypothetical protein